MMSDYHNSFLNFVEKVPENKDGEDGNDMSENSDDSSSKQESRKAPTSKPNVAKRGRLRGPKSARSRVSKNNKEKSSESEPASEDDKGPKPARRRVSKNYKEKGSESEPASEDDKAPKPARRRVSKNYKEKSSESEPASEDDKQSYDDKPPAVPRRGRPPRASKAKALEKTKRLVKRRKKNSDVESDSSAAAAAESDEEFLAADEDDGRHSADDTDEDPVWRPKKPKTGSIGSARKRLSRDSGSERGDDSKPGRGRNASRGRGRGLANGVSPKPGSTKVLPDVVPPTGTSAPATTSSTDKIIPATTSSADKSEVVKPFVGYVPRPVGRPPNFPAVVNPAPVATAATAPNKVGPLAAVATTENYIPDLNPPHNCQKGDFILDRRDSNNYTTFPIWRIDSQRLLQKFEAFEKDDKLLHRALCTYSSWPVHAQHNYTAVAVRYVSCTRGKEIVEVQEKYRPRPLGVQGAELDALREAFTIYTQILLSQALEPTFIGALIEEPDEYYTEPMEKVEKVVTGRLEKVEKLCNWDKEFLISLKKFHAFTLIDCPEGSSWSQATANRNEQAKKSVRFHGHIYNHGTLETTEQVVENNGQEYSLTASESIIVTVLHGLQHLKFKLCLVCQTRVEELKESSPNIEDHEVLDTCLRDQPWMQQMFSRLSSLLENADRVAGL